MDVRIFFVFDFNRPLLLLFFVVFKLEDVFEEYLKARITDVCDRSRTLATKMMVVFGRVQVFDSYSLHAYVAFSIQKQEKEFYD